MQFVRLVCSPAGGESVGKLAALLADLGKQTMTFDFDLGQIVRLDDLGNPLGSRQRRVLLPRGQVHPLRERQPQPSYWDQRSWTRVPAQHRSSRVPNRGQLAAIQQGEDKLQTQLGSEVRGHRVERAATTHAVADNPTQALPSPLHRAVAVAPLTLLVSQHRVHRGQSQLAVLAAYLAQRPHRYIHQVESTVKGLGAPTQRGLKVRVRTQHRRQLGLIEHRRQERQGGIPVPQRACYRGELHTQPPARLGVNPLSCLRKRLYRTWHRGHTTADRYQAVREPTFGPQRGPLITSRSSQPSSLLGQRGCHLRRAPP